MIGWAICTLAILLMCAEIYTNHQAHERVLSAVEQEDKDTDDGWCTFFDLNVTDLRKEESNGRKNSRNKKAS